MLPCDVFTLFYAFFHETGIPQYLADCHCHRLRISRNTELDALLVDNVSDRRKIRADDRTTGREIFKQLERRRITHEVRMIRCGCRVETDIACGDGRWNRRRFNATLESDVMRM